MKFILGKKVNMTQLWQGETVVPVTKIMAGPCTVLQLKNKERDGYQAVQVGYGDRRASLITKVLRGHFKDFGNFRFVREFRIPETEKASEVNPGDKITVHTFAIGDRLTITGTSKGKGFQGVVKRHGFHGQDATHGNKDQLRMSGSIGAGGIQHVLKGMRMGGRMGGDRVTLHDVEVISIDETDNSLLVKGAVPGARNGLVLLSAEGDLVTGEPVVETPVEPVVEGINNEEEILETHIEETPITESTPTEVTEEVKDEVVTEEAPKEGSAEEKSTN
jgi:large subunit ribosomal protein L3